MPIVWNIKKFKEIFISGGLCFGNINIEIINYSKVLREHKIVPDKDGIIGIAFEPMNSIEETIINLNKYKIKNGGIEPYKEYIHRESKILWKNIFLDKLLEESQTFFCKYELDTEKRRKSLMKTLKDKEGGTFKIREVAEVVVGYSKEETLKKWGEITLGEDEFIKKFEEGPTLRFVENEKDEILYILLKVESIDNVKEILKDNKRILIDEKNQLIIKGEKNRPLGIKLCE